MKLNNYFQSVPEFGPGLSSSSFNIAKFLDLFLCFENCENLGPLRAIKIYASLVEKSTLKQILTYFLLSVPECSHTHTKILSLCNSLYANNFQQKKGMERLSAGFILGYYSYMIDTV